MLGNEDDYEGVTNVGITPPDPATRGIIPRAVEQIFQEAERQKTTGWNIFVSVSYLQIYCEIVCLAMLDIYKSIE